MTVLRRDLTVIARRYDPLMSQPPDLEARVTALETEVRDLAERVRHSQQDAVAARVLAGGADRDVSEMGREIREFREQNTRVLNAMREDLADLRSHVDEGFARVDERFARIDEGFARVDERFARIDDRFARVDEGFVSVDNGFAEIRGRLDAAAAGQQQIASMLSTLIDAAGEAGNDQ
jgi:predicted  nucleic acid-binding Zn-ribbon protein